MARKKPIQLSQKGKKLINDYIHELDSNLGIQSENFKLNCSVYKQHYNVNSESKFSVTFKNSWDEGGGTDLKKIWVICTKCADNT